MQKGTQNYLHGTQCINQKKSRIQKRKGKVNVSARGPPSPPLTSICVSLYVSWLTARAASRSDPSREEAPRNEQDHGGLTKESRTGIVPPEDQQSLAS